MILEGNDDKRENHNVFFNFCFEFFTYSQSRIWRCLTLDKITTANDAEEEGDEEHKKNIAKGTTDPRVEFILPK